MAMSTDNVQMRQVSRHYHEGKLYIWPIAMLQDWDNNLAIFATKTWLPIIQCCLNAFTQSEETIGFPNNSVFAQSIGNNHAMARSRSRSNYRDRRVSLLSLDEVATWLWNLSWDSTTRANRHHHHHQLFPARSNSFQLHNRYFGSTFTIYLLFRDDDFNFTISTCSLCFSGAPLRLLPTYWCVRSPSSLTTTIVRGLAKTGTLLRMPS